MREKVVKVDVRDDLRRGREPFSKIMTTVAQLHEHESLLLIAPFEPKPLYAVLAEHGFFYDAKPQESGDWEVLFTRTPQSPPRQRASSSSKANVGSKNVVEVDARGLEPPQPMVRILEALTTLPKRAELLAHTDRRPMHLYAQLKERGFTGQSKEQPDGSFITYIRHV